MDQATGELDFAADGFNIYPNPSGDGRFIIQWGAMENRSVTLEIYSTSGQLLRKTNAQTGTDAILELGSQRGAYLLNIPELNIRKKLVVQ